MDQTVGILGGGQLGRMMLESANNLGIKVIVLETSEDCPANQINPWKGGFVKGSFKDPEAVKKLASQADVVTAEIEHINVDMLQALTDGDETAAGNKSIIVQPHPSTFRTIQDKFDQKQYLLKRNIPVARSAAVSENVAEAIRSVGGCPVFLKARTGAYDGRGNYALDSESEIPEAVEALGGNKALYVEERIPFRTELAVMVVKIEDKADVDWDTGTLAFPVVETLHEDSICKLVYLPPRGIDKQVLRKAQETARKAVAGFGGKGVFGVEMFLLRNGDILINEIAPRPHNSGHLTIEACGLSQFEAHLRAVLGIAINPTSLEADRVAIMLNILGAGTPTGHLLVRDAALKIPGASIHLYGKGAGRPERKMGHVTVTAKTLMDAERKILPLIDLVDRLRAERLGIKISSAAEYAKIVEPPRIAITMGSDSDKKILDPGAALLRKWGIPYESNITSAHRTPERMIEYARKASERGVQCIIAAAGGAAHLPGMLAACTNVVVIGVPVKASQLDGMDSVLSMVQMPKGCPVATVGINNSENAAQLAMRILGASDPEVRKKVDQLLEEQTSEVTNKGERMQRLGIEGYTWPPAS